MNNTDGQDPAKSPAADTTIFSVIHAAHALEEKLEDALEKAELSMPKFSVLNELVSAGEALSLSELASRLSCVRSNMTQLVDRLEADGLVRRVACPTDRRSVKAEITDAGRARQADGSREVTRLQDEVAAGVPVEDRATLVRLLAHLK
ncbi:MAG TPA: MarR family transcriptional regulator [Gemmatimonadaceae bacterium]|nr:MarR family transcriptional regulator [Gemmatimonadaceae bacterium]